MDQKKRRLLKRLGLATTAGGVTFNSSISAGFLSSTTTSSSPSISEIAIETAKHPSKPLIAYTSNVYSGGYIGLYLSRDTTSTSDSPNDPSVLAQPNEYGVWGLEWVGESTLEYQDGLVTRTSKIGGDDNLLHTRTTDQRGRGLLNEDKLVTSGSLPRSWRKMLQQITDIKITDPESFSDQYGTSIASPTAYATNAYCSRNHLPVKGPGGGSAIGGGGDDGGDDDGNSGNNCIPTRSPGGSGSDSDSTTTTTTTTTTSTTTTTTSTSTTATTTTTSSTSDVCTSVDHINMIAPMMMDVLQDGLEGMSKEFSPFNFDDCNGKKQRHLLAFPVLDKKYHYDCDGNAIEMNKMTLWVGLDMKAIVEKRSDCKLFLGLSEEIGGGIGGTAWKEVSACKPLCEEGEKLVEALEPGGTPFLEAVGQVVDTIAYWAEENSETSASSEVLKIFILIGLVSALIIATGIAVGALYYGVSYTVATIVLGILGSIVGSAG